MKSNNTLDTRQKWVWSFYTRQKSGRCRLCKWDPFNFPLTNVYSIIEEQVIDVLFSTLIYTSVFLGSSSQCFFIFAGDVLVLGKNEVFKFNFPVEAAKLREKRRSFKLKKGVSKSSLCFLISIASWELDRFHIIL